MYFNDNLKICSVIIIFIFILGTIKKEFYNNTHLYEFIKCVIAIFLIIFILYLFLILIRKIYIRNRIIPEENDIEKNNKEIIVLPDGVQS
jgi:hypothetical protein